MLEKIDLSKNLTKKEVKPLMEKLDMRLSGLQREARALGIPVMILFEGWGAAGKGTLINRLIQPMDPRGFKVFTIQEASEESVIDDEPAAETVNAQKRSLKMPTAILGVLKKRFPLTIV